MWLYLKLKIDIFANKPKIMNSNSTSNQNDSSKNTMSVFSLIMITSALFLTLRNVPMMVEVGMQMIFFNVIAGVGFITVIACFIIGFIPSGMPAIDYELIMILSVGLIVLIPIIIFKKNSLNRK